MIIESGINLILIKSLGYSKIVHDNWRASHIYEPTCQQKYASPGHI